jgi:hypothetical protein
LPEPRARGLPASIALRPAALVLAAALAAALQVVLQQSVPSLVFAEMLLEPWLVLQGLVPYRDYFQHHTPW